MFLVQVLTHLQPLDYLVVAFLPGFSEVAFCFIQICSTDPTYHPFLIRVCSLLHPLCKYRIARTKLLRRVMVLQELLFRGAALPLFGNNWASALVVAALFGVLHLGSGRKYSFAIWYSFIILHPMNNLLHNKAYYDCLLGHYRFS